VLRGRLRTLDDGDQNDAISGRSTMSAPVRKRS
jgi:hypothetical protein